MSKRACAELAVHADHLAIVAPRIRIIVAVEIGESSGEIAEQPAALPVVARIAF
jgi:hypothetical protein